MEEIYKLEDFSLESESESEYYNRYILNKDYIILNKKACATDYIAYNLTIYLHKKLKFTKYISKINEYINWLNSLDCKNKLIKYFYKFNIEYFNEYGIQDIIEEYKEYASEELDINKIICNKWYEDLEVWKAYIIIDKKGNMFSKFICEDSIFGGYSETLNFCVNENDIFEMEYEDMGDPW